MKFNRTSIDGVYVIETDQRSDARGFFARLFCVDEFSLADISFMPRQMSLSRNFALHTLRGMHFCLEPEAKMVRCVKGAILDVVFDIRRDSSTFGHSFGITLDDRELRGLFIAPGLAHGFLTLQSETDVLYQMERIYRPGFDAGLRWDDPMFAYAWPVKPAVINQRDDSWPDFH